VAIIYLQGSYSIWKMQHLDKFTSCCCSNAVRRKWSLARAADGQSSQDQDCEHSRKRNLLKGKTSCMGNVKIRFLFGSSFVF
jgi:hypothetical protein